MAVLRLNAGSAKVEAAYPYVTYVFGVKQTLYEGGD